MKKHLESIHDPSGEANTASVSAGTDGNPGDGSGWINLETLERLQEDMGGDISRLLEKFLEKLPVRIDTIVTALENDDRQLLSAEAHRLKGSARTIGADGLADLCFQLEGAKVTGHSLDLADLVSRLEKQGDGVKGALKGILADG